ncbi:Phosphoenolpyruvate carboxykinase [Bienertia sinuspersici]
MTQKKIILRPAESSTTHRRRQPLLHPSPSSSSSSSSSSSHGRIAEVAGGTTAECAAVWCCCPCTLVNLLVLVVYKVPAGICKKALRIRRRKRMMKKGLFPLPSYAASSRGSNECHCNGIQSEEVTMVVMGGSRSSSDESVIMDKDLIQLEEHMWEHFYNTGFWRSHSQREKQNKLQQ